MVIPFECLSGQCWGRRRRPSCVWVSSAAGPDHSLGQEGILCRMGSVSRLVQSNWKSVREAGSGPVLVVAPPGTGGTHLSLPQGTSGWGFLRCAQHCRDGGAFSSQLLPPADRPRGGELRALSCRAPRLLPIGSPASRAHTALPTIINFPSK